MDVSLNDLKEMLKQFYTRRKTLEKRNRTSKMSVNLLKDFTKNFSMEVKKGFVTGFIGGNGSGKSTTIKMIMNLMNPDSGNVFLFA